MTASSPSATAPHTRQLLLTGQAAAPPGPVDVAGMYLMHRAFRRDLDLFAAATAATPIEDRQCWARLSRRWQLFSSTLHKHHLGEDTGLWPLLLERARGAEAGAVLAAMSAEHKHIDPLLHACDTGFAMLARAGDAQVRRDLAGHTAELRDLLLAHLAHEERDAMALVQAHLTQHDWERLDKEHFSAQYSPRDIPAVLGWIVHGLPPHAVRLMPGGPVLRAAGRVLARRFARAERRTFHHVSPADRP
ncbi:hemerythrin domain-containing protein [Nonomuraea sp. 10N515B]|uniref:hemerythrin domain-containing protein n=1 Tax=Nonomuraea sp. 10N515B TaxID=3457422 RepID=UPI003FCD8117